MTTLILNLKKEWYDKIYSLEKKEEYRDLSAFWISRLCNCRAMNKCIKNYEAVEFRNGYSKNCRRMIFECKGIRIGIGDKEFGASGEKQFIISLGELIKTNKLDRFIFLNKNE